ncbi:hypothetical protein BU14_0254s0022 [Porphyra umbilicalis]|uniref:DEAD-box RNA helicase Q domain-containing protein n=1 Tax=Porphyra umbilicalis TaxID=2786 RepID=A0A1X6P3E6_PORUM|nr:hypothetical protein BU14_0254s0022 [Porphyra umbilicalis]|eukprot:OSX75143.1 hypothetical protein BU14_0254s0022 [Porphyra umbilicalis]
MPVVDPTRPLLEQASALRAATAGLQSNALERLAAEEAAIMADLAAKKALRSVGERAADVAYTEPMPSSWTPPRFLSAAGEAHHEAVRKKNYILVEGNNVPPPCISFREMKLPPVLLSTMRAKGIKKPSPIQMQGLPVALAGRDMIGIAFTGSGKTLAFALPAVLAAWEAEARLPLTGGEGPIALLICPSRELARQTRDVVQGFFDDIAGVSTVTVIEDEVTRAKREKRERKEWRRLERLRRAARSGGGGGGAGDGGGGERADPPPHLRAAVAKSPTGWRCGRCWPLAARPWIWRRSSGASTLSLRRPGGCSTCCAKSASRSTRARSCASTKPTGSSTSALRRTSARCLTTFPRSGRRSCFPQRCRPKSKRLPPRRSSSRSW